MKLRYFIFFSIALFFISCNSDTKTSTDISDAEINIRLSRDPQKINPFFSPSAIGREVYQYIFLPLANYHPKTLELCPILINKIPEGRLETYKGQACVAFDIEFRPEAQWSDGQPITASDYLFTIKAVNHPDSKISAWKPYFQFLKGFKVDDDPRKFTVYFDASYMLAKEVALTPPLMPVHIYDKQAVLEQINISDLMTENYEAKDSVELNVIAAVNAAASKKLDVVQSGPYSLSSFETNQYIQLDRKENYWGEAIKDIPYLENNLSKITFKIVPDEVTAITMAKEGKLDLLLMRSSNQFLELKDDETFAEQWTFHTPQLLIYYYMALNNKSPILRDPKVRRALAHLADIEDYIETLDGGMGIRTTGHFHPVRSYYNDTLPLIPYNIDQARQLLSEAGWDDRDGDGVRDKLIAGEKENLELEILQSGASLGKNVSLLYQAAAEQAGVKIKVTTKKMSLMAKENLYDYKYDIALLRVGMDEAADDPYPRWHSDNALPGGSNQLGYVNENVDALIEQLRITRDAEARKQIYQDIQAEMYKDTPCIFLYSPLNKLLISNKFKALATTKRPGYLANTFLVAE
jgi:peptide/nickel transport system substrate-binding protein